MLLHKHLVEQTTGMALMIEINDYNGIQTRINLVCKQTFNCLIKMVINDWTVLWIRISMVQLYVHVKYAFSEII